MKEFPRQKSFWLSKKEDILTTRENYEKTNKLQR